MHPGFNLPDPGDPLATVPPADYARRDGVPAEDAEASAARSLEPDFRPGGSRPSAVPPVSLAINAIACAGKLGRVLGLL
ncbi:MAG: hypothetical protein AAGJ97_08515 [Planctomycetota bacterium]